MNKMLVIVAPALAILWVPAQAQENLFDQKIRPILSESCFQCHGPDEESRKANLRLDERASAIADHGGVAAIVPGDADASELIRRITTDDPNDRMPPPDVGEALSAEQVELMREWIAAGAEWPAHWAFVPPLRSAVPEIANPDWARNPIDHFVAAKFTAAGLTPSPEADRLTLLRRLSLDLVGLPPTLEEIDRVLTDGSANWYEAAVDRLLASPHYGERWARHWMDAAQYADSDGFEKDKPRFVWAWREWVINAFNNDMPYDEFVVTQIAGDLLPNAGQDERVATGFLRNSMINEEGGIHPEQFRMEAMFNRVDLVGRAVLGLTVQCAQCHTHKYDPLTHTEYYSMLAYLNSSHEACIPVYTAEERAQQDTLGAFIDDLKNDIKKEMPDWRARMAAWEAETRKIPSPEWHSLEFTFDDSSAGGQRCMPQGDGSYLAQGYAPTRHAPKMTAPAPIKKITAMKLELLTDPNLPRNGPGRSIYGSSALSEIEFNVGDKELLIAKYGDWKRVPIASAIADVNPPERVLGEEYPERGRANTRVTGGIEMAFDGDNNTAWTTDIDPVNRNQARYAIFTFAEPVAIAENEIIAIRLPQMHGGYNSDDNQNNNLGRFRISVTGEKDLPKTAIPVAVQAVLAKDPSERTAEDEDVLFDYWRTTVPKLGEVNGRIAGLERAYPSGTTQLVLEERDTPRETHRLERGDYLSLAEVVKPKTPEFLHPLEVREVSPRLRFAEWLVSPNSATTARAYVNRVWLRYFGEGIVSTPSDLGMQGARPSHPALLDWLAVEFVESGWGIKDLHRMIVSSATYRQASNTSAEALEKDPYNRLLARGARFRVESEIVRDIALAASGLLNPTIGGPSVYPPAPEFLFEPPASYGPKTWNTDVGADRYRRGIYTFRFRSVPYPVMQVFDAPQGDAPCTRRGQSNTPLQALTTLNEPLFMECARGLAEITLAQGGDQDRERIDYAFRRCVTRMPSDDEAEELQSFLDGQRARLETGAIDAATILEPTLLATEPTAELAAWTLLSRVLLNLDETIVRQ